MSKLSTFERFKTLVKKYWFVAVPVHAATSVVWFGSFYGATKAGLDFVPLLEKTPIPSKYIEPLKKADVGNLVIALAMYKLITPVRYATTVGLTSKSIKYIRARGFIK